MVDEYAELSRKTARLFAHMSDAVVADFYFKIDDDVGAWCVGATSCKEGDPSPAVWAGRAVWGAAAVCAPAPTTCTQSPKLQAPCLACAQRL